MKRIFNFSALMLGLALLLPCLAVAQEAGQNPMMAPLPADTAVRIGRLPNGLTYYIRHNENPKGQADFYIAQNVGSILENDNQRGLAHFLEHMCFNGTTNFPGNALRDWLQSIGVKFGQNLNAFTAVDKTVYNISNVPVARTSVQDSCLLILHDWANDLTLADKDIDEERAVIHEEWRTNNKGQMRILEQLLPVIFPTSKYGQRLPIGTMEVVDNFPYQTLRDYYEAWYRPDQQGIIVVGDVDVDRIEGKIKEMFSPIEMPKNAPERKYEKVPDHKGTIYAIGSDPEQQNLLAQMYFISEGMPREMKNTLMGYVQNYINFVTDQMMADRFNAILSKPDAPFAYAGVGNGTFILADNEDALTGMVVAKDNDIVPGLQAMYREVLRAQRGGFTQSEYDRAVEQYKAAYETAYNNRATRANDTYVQECVANFTDGDAMPGIDIEYQLSQQLPMMIPLEAVNEAFKQTVTPDNRVVMVMAPAAEGYTVPTEQQLAAALAAVDAETIEAHKEVVKSEPLVPVQPTPGKITKTQKLKDWDATEWTLSNGAKVIVKPTKYKEDQILFYAYAEDGTRRYGPEYDNSVRAMALMPTGLGDYTQNDLAKYVAGKQTGLGANYGEYSRAMQGSTTPKNINTLMELIYMTFKDTRYYEDEFVATQKQTISFLKNQEKDPQFAFKKAIPATLYKSTRRQAMMPEVVEAASMPQMQQIVTEMTANAADYTFLFLGNVNEKELKPLVEKYIASLPGNAATKSKKVARADADLIATGSEVTTVTTPMETPMTYVAILQTGTEPYNMKNDQMADILGQILTTRLVNKIREEMGAVYSIWAAAGLSDGEKQNYALQSTFPMKPEMKEAVLAEIQKQINYLGSTLTQDELNVVREFMVKNAREGREQNMTDNGTGWFNGMTNWISTGVDTFNRNIDSLNSITVEDLQALAREVAAQGNYRAIVLEASK